MVLRIATAGSVDDGKSTLIGRLLHDSKSVFEDQLRSVERASRRYGDGSANLALLTDGLRAEREQGITIDVAYRYFATPARTFVVADTPGHAQYTRNMVTGASVSDVAIVLVDARTGMTEQTRRHLLVASLLGIRRAVLAVNKMDLVEFDEDVFRSVVNSVRDHAAKLPFGMEIEPIPISALLGDNVVEASKQMPWHDGEVLLDFLERVDGDSIPDVGARLAVQWVSRPQVREHHDFRGISGRLSGGPLKVDDQVVLLPSGSRSRVTSIRHGGRWVDEVQSGRSVCIEIADDIDVGRGDVVVAAEASKRPEVSDRLVADVCWMVERTMQPGTRWSLKHGTKMVRAIIDSVNGRYDILTGALEPADHLALNDLGRLELQTTSPLVVDAYDVHRRGGSAILVDESSGMTAGALMIRGGAR
ncbi:MAG: sulfate adenylyltransferase subunit 1 [Ilumatobacteraceae bacterium]